MTPRYSRNAVIITLVHIAVIVALLVVGWIRSLIPEKPKEITTFVELRAAEPTPPAPDPLPPDPDPTPPEPTPPEPQPEPPPPEPVKKKVEKKKIEVSTERVVRNAPPPTPPPRTKVDPNDLARKLRQDLPTTTATTKDPVPDWYYAVIRRAMYELWNQPSASSVQPGAMTRVSIRIRRDGTVTLPKMVRSSGNAAMDASVMTAVRSAGKLKELPPEYPGDYKDVTVDFELTGI